MLVICSEIKKKHYKSDKIQKKESTLKESQNGQ